MDEPLLAEGTLEIVDDGYGFLLGGRQEIYVSRSQIERHNLKAGDRITGIVRPPKDSERYYGLLRVNAINGTSLPWPNL